jgi:hypothetical protein
MRPNTRLLCGRGRGFRGISAPLLLWGKCMRVQTYGYIWPTWLDTTSHQSKPVGLGVGICAFFVSNRNASKNLPLLFAGFYRWGFKLEMFWHAGLIVPRWYFHLGCRARTIPFFNTPNGGRPRKNGICGLWTFGCRQLTSFWCFVAEIFAVDSPADRLGLGLEIYGGWGFDRPTPINLPMITWRRNRLRNVGILYRCRQNWNFVAIGSVAPTVVFLLFFAS